MTLAVALRFPWPAYIDSVSPRMRAVWDTFPGLRPRPGLIFAGDSRWTYVDANGRVVRRDDGAIKLAPIDSHGGAAYAGNTDAGEAAIEWLTTEFLRARLGADRDDLRDVLKEAFAKYRRGPMDVLQFSIGFFDHENIPHLFRLDSWSGFLPFEVSGATWLGSSDGSNFVKAELRSELARSGDVGQVHHDPSQWAGLLEAMIWKFGQDEIDKSVGGSTVSIVVTPDGVSRSSLFGLDTQNPADGAKRISLDKEEVERFYDHPLRRRSQHRTKWKFNPR